ncbi:MAG: hypothetical protein R3E96_11990 [Planctomycetota bacterium]
MGVTALAALAWIGGGSSLTPGRTGEPGEGHRLPARWPGPGRRSQGYFTQTGDQVSRTHGHGLATLALAQAFTISPRGAKGARIEAALELACERILEAQGVDGVGTTHPPRRWSRRLGDRGAHVGPARRQRRGHPHPGQSRSTKP